MLLRTIFRASRLSYCCYSTATTSNPPLLLKIRSDLKTAMREKDTTRLTVLRSLLSQTLNASKTSSPINTDMQLLALLRKNAKSTKAAAEEFQAAGRMDLVEKEEGQLAIMEEYAGAVEVVGEDEIRSFVLSAVEGLRGEGAPVAMGEIMKRVFAADALGEKNVDKGEVAKAIKELIVEVNK